MESITKYAKKVEDVPVDLPSLVVKFKIRNVIRVGQRDAVIFKRFDETETLAEEKYGQVSFNLIKSTWCLESQSFALIISKCCLILLLSLNKT